MPSTFNEVINKRQREGKNGVYRSCALSAVRSGVFIGTAVSPYRDPLEYLNTSLGRG